MNAPSQRPTDLPEPSIVPVQGWHCTHYFYRFNRSALAAMSVHQRNAGKESWREILTPPGSLPTERLQTAIVSGHKADFMLMMLDNDPLKIDAVHQQLLASPLGPALETTYSFVSMSEISEYVPSPEQYAERLKNGGEDPNSPAFAAKVAAYERRLPMMNEQRLRPEIPPWPSLCFYPMNKARVVGANWFDLPYSQRNEMMAEHAQSGMAFAGRVSQLVTVAVGLDDWEWGVTLWARNPQYLKDIVYKMRFDKASARYGEFGEFFVGYVSDSDAILKHCCIA
jgi:chlorite dismutase